jgi:Rieske Fe-S protein
MPEPTDPVLSGAGLTRRRVLSVAAVSGGATLLSACGGGGEASDPGENGTSSAAPTDAESSDAGGGALVAVADVPVGGGVILEGERVVVTQPTEGEFKGFTATCTHQSCTVASVKNDQISCACHGSAFSATDGSVINGPATRPLSEVAVAVEGDQVVRA